MYQVLNILSWFKLIDNNNILSTLYEINRSRNKIVHNYILNVHRNDSVINNIKGKMSYYLQVYKKLVFLLGEIIEEKQK